MGLPRCRDLVAFEAVAQRGSVRRPQDTSGMPQNFIDCDREQTFLMPPSLREWLPQDDLAWCVIDAAKEMDLSAFYASYRQDGHGRAAYEPSMMVALVLYAFATQQRSSRAIERHCRRDVAYRVITANQVPDHATIARFIERHEAALSELFSQVLSLCAKAGLVKVGVIAIDGTKVKANASPEANCDYGQIAREILAEARATDEAEDELYGDARGDELPEHLRTAEGRRAALREAKLSSSSASALKRRRRRSEHPRRVDEATAAVGGQFDSERIVARVQGREGWLREARRQLEGQRWAEREPVPRSRTKRLLFAPSGAFKRSYKPAERLGNDEYERYRATGRDERSRDLGASHRSPISRRPSHRERSTSPIRIQSRQRPTRGSGGCRVTTRRPWSQGQIVLAAEVKNSTADWPA